MSFKISLRVEGRHAARAGRGDRLAVHVILYVATCEHTGHGCLHAVASDDVAVAVQIETIGNIRCRFSGQARLGWSADQADAHIKRLWVPNDTWTEFIASSRRTLADAHSRVN